MYTGVYRSHRIMSMTWLFESDLMEEINIHLIAIRNQLSVTKIRTFLCSPFFDSDVSKIKDRMELNTSNTILPLIVFTYEMLYVCCNMLKVINMGYCKYLMNPTFCIYWQSLYLCNSFWYSCILLNSCLSGW